MKKHAALWVKKGNELSVNQHQKRSPGYIVGKKSQVAKQQTVCCLLWGEIHFCILWYLHSVFGMRPKKWGVAVWRGWRVRAGWRETRCRRRVFPIYIFFLIELQTLVSYFTKADGWAERMLPSWSADGFPGRWSLRPWLSVWSTTTPGKRSCAWGGSTGHASQKLMILWWVKLVSRCLCGPRSRPTPRLVSGWRLARLYGDDYLSRWWPTPWRDSGLHFLAQKCQKEGASDFPPELSTQFKEVRACLASEAPRVIPALTWWLISGCPWPPRISFLIPLASQMLLAREAQPSGFPTASVKHDQGGALASRPCQELSIIEE